MCVCSELMVCPASILGLQLLLCRHQQPLMFPAHTFASGKLPAVLTDVSVMLT
jgi:hypothetical protein